MTLPSLNEDPDSDESDYELYESEFKMKPLPAPKSRKAKVKKKKQRRHTRAMTVHFDQKEEDPDMKSAFQILAIRPAETGLEFNKTMDNAPDLIQYELEVNVDESDIASMMESASEDEEDDSTEVVLPAVPISPEDIEEHNEFIQNQAK